MKVGCITSSWGTVCEIYEAGHRLNMIIPIFGYWECHYGDQTIIDRIFFKMEFYIQARQVLNTGTIP